VCLLVEHFFATNPDEFAWSRDPGRFDKMADAHVLALQKYIGKHMEFPAELMPEELSHLADAKTAVTRGFIGTGPNGLDGLRTASRSVLAVVATRVDDAGIKRHKEAMAALAGLSTQIGELTTLVGSANAAGSTMNDTLAGDLNALSAVVGQTDEAVTNILTTMGETVHRVTTLENSTVTGQVVNTVPGSNAASIEDSIMNRIGENIANAITGA
jgi:hypothetical protein